MFTFHLFQNQPVTAVVTSTADGNVDSRFDPPDTVNQNLNSICSQLQLNPETLVQMQQTHRTNVNLIDASQQGQTIPDSDGLITKDHNITLMLRLADCVPIFIFDPNTATIALVHSGWRGTMGKIGLVAVQALMRHFQTRPENLLVALGPSVQPQSNLWDEPPLQSQLPEWQPFIKSVGGKYQIDLPGFIVNTLTQAGVKPENIDSSAVDTVTDTNLFSYLRSKQTGEREGRFAALFKLKDTSSI